MKYTIGIIGSLILGGLFALIGAFLLGSIGTIIGFIVGFSLSAIATENWIHPPLKAKCPYCDFDLSFHKDNVGITCPACKKHSVIREGKLFKVLIIFNLFSFLLLLL